MCCIDACSVRKAYPELLKDERCHVACGGMVGGLVVGPRVGRLVLPGMRYNAREVVPDQGT